MLLVALSGGAGAQDVPAHDGWVTDLADLLTDEQERALETLMESYRAGTTHEIALLTVPALDGRALERLALETARAWGLGGQGANNGALLLVARDDRKLRLEVGQGLEGTLTDSIAGRIIRDVITPRFKAGDMYGGIRAGLEATHAAIGGDYGPVEQVRARRPGSGGLGLIPVFAVFMLVLLGGRRRGRGGGLLPWLVLSQMGHGRNHHGGGGGFSGGGGGFSGFGGGGGFSGGGASGGW